MQAVLSHGDRALAEVLLAIPSGCLTVRSFHQALAEHGLAKEQYTGAWEVGAPLPWDIVQSGVSENYFHYELRLAAQDQTGLSCPPDSAGCLACQACDESWAFRYGDNARRPVPAAKGGPWRAQDWQPWTRLRGRSTGSWRRSCLNRCQIDFGSTIGSVEGQSKSMFKRRVQYYVFTDLLFSGESPVTGGEIVRGFGIDL